MSQTGVPRIIHQIWFQGADRVPAKYHTNMQRLRDLNPGWRHRVWSDPELRAACQAVSPLAATAYMLSTAMHQKIDLGRMCVLYLHGGISVDVDAEPLRPLDSLPGLTDIDRLAVTQIPYGSLETLVSMQECIEIRGGQWCAQVNNACLLSPPRDPGLLHVIQHCAALIARTDPSQHSQYSLVNATTGPKEVGRALTTLPSADMVWVLPDKYFEPCLMLEEAGCQPGPETILHHKGDQSWIPAHHRAAGMITGHLKRYWPLLLGALLVACILMRRF